MKYYFVLTTFLISSFAIAQNQGAVKGTILDQEMNNEPLLFANVHLKNTSTSAETNFHGNFEFNHVEAGDYILVLRYVGYETQEFPVAIKENEITVVQLSMKAQNISLKELEQILPSSASQTKTAEISKRD